MKSLIVTLDKDYTISEFTVEQIENVQASLGAFGPANSTVVLSKDANRQIIAIALSVDHQEVTSAAIAKMRLGSVRKINAIVTDILRFSGFIASEEATPGETKPVA